MLLVLSPSKTLDFENPPPTYTRTMPDMLEDSQLLIDELRQYSSFELAKLMDISEKLAALNIQRYRDFTVPFTRNNAKQALFAFRGDVYEGIEINEYDKDDFAFAQKHVRILSGLYGLLRPLDLIQPYRLEMGTKLPNPRGKDLYAFWGTRISESLNKALARQKSKWLVNLASEEYFKAVKPSALDAKILHIVFKENHKGNLKVIGLFAKQARGLMANFVIKNRVADKEELKDFNAYGYRFAPELSESEKWVFIR